MQLMCQCIIPGAKLSPCVSGTRRANEKKKVSMPPTNYLKKDKMAPPNHHSLLLGECTERNTAKPRVGARIHVNVPGMSTGIYV